jgi:FKBP-type peptidyl-prolyl cis-trans isomerase
MLALFTIAASSAELLNLTPDGKVTKEILQAGTGSESPVAGDQVRVEYTGQFPDGTVFDKRDSFTFTVGRAVIPGWSMAVQTMKIGERAKLFVDYPYGYGERGYPPVVPARTALVFELELLERIPQ